MLQSITFLIYLLICMLCWSFIILRVTVYHPVLLPLYFVSLLLLWSATINCCCPLFATVWTDFWLFYLSVKQWIWSPDKCYFSFPSPGVSQWTVNFWSLCVLFWRCLTPTFICCLQRGFSNGPTAAVCCVNSGRNTAVRTPRGHWKYWANMPHSVVLYKTALTLPSVHSVSA